MWGEQVISTTILEFPPNTWVSVAGGSGLWKGASHGYGYKYTGSLHTGTQVAYIQVHTAERRRFKMITDFYVVVLIIINVWMPYEG